MNDYKIPLIEPQQLADFHRYDSDEIPFIQMATLAAQSLLYNAGAWDKNNPLTELAVTLMVGHFLENRDLMNIDMKNMEKFPISITGIINSLRFYHTE